MSEHMSSDLHAAISKFLFPQCNVCSTKFYSPMAYEKHIATLNHIKVIGCHKKPSRDNTVNSSF
jgi:hypothetical protein